MVVSKQTRIYQGFRRFQHLPGGAGPTFSRVIQMLNSIETDITCDISRGSGPPIPTSGSVHDWIRIGFGNPANTVSRPIIKTPFG